MHGLRSRESVIPSRHSIPLSLTDSSKISQVPGTRFTEKYLHARMASSKGYGSPYAPYIPARKASASGSPPAPKIPTPSHSPPRKVVTDFAAFGAPANSSVFGTAVASTPFSLAGGKAAFGGMRGAARGISYDDEDEDDDDNGRQKIELREGSISLDQARRIALQSAWRGIRA